MSAEQTDAASPADDRQAIFRALVDAQDGGLSVAASRAAIARQFSLSEQDVKEIEKEGLANQWPPL
jgi:hypothetical protein